MILSMGNKETKTISVMQAANILGVSRVQVVRKIQSGTIPAQKIGRAYSIKEEDLPGIHQPSTKIENQRIKKAVDKMFKQHGDVMKKLGDA